MIADCDAWTSAALAALEKGAWESDAPPRSPSRFAQLPPPQASPSSNSGGPRGDIAKQLVGSSQYRCVTLCARAVAFP